jgi:hypothetical protein
MKATSNATQTMQQLSPPLLHRLNLYALAASAACVASLALAEPAEARIVYTPAHIRILVNELTDLDLNHDGIKDFQFRNIYGTHKNSTMSIIPARSSNRVWEAPARLPYLRLRTARSRCPRGKQSDLAAHSKRILPACSWPRTRGIRADPVRILAAGPGETLT